MGDSLTTAQYAVKREVFDKCVADEDFVSAWIALAKHHLTMKISEDMRKSLEKELEQAINFPKEFKAKWENDFSKIPKEVVSP